MDLDIVREERLRCINWKDIKPRWEMISKLPKLNDIEVKLGSSIEICSNTISRREVEYVKGVAEALIPWRKGPFRLFDTIFIDSEWRSYMKYSLIEKHLDLEGKVVGDIGCNNGYYLFRMLDKGAKELIGFDPFPLYYCHLSL